VDVMRFTIIDIASRISFVAPCPVLDALVAGCAQQPTTLVELLDAATPFAPDLKDRVLSGLAVFDEHNSPHNLERIHSALCFCEPEQVPVFRILDGTTRDASTTPERAGVVLFNLREKRIVQLQNTYCEIKRKGRIREARSPATQGRVRRYELPPDWSLVPSR
jgi:hypothetical protein